MNNLEETFCYDNLNRLTEIRLGGVCTVTYTGFDKVLKVKQGGGNGGNMGNGTVSSTPESNSNYDADLEIAADVLLTINLYTTIESSFYYNRLTRTWRDKMDIFRSFDFHGNGSTGGMNSYGNLMSNRYNNAGRVLGSLGVFISATQCINATSIDDQLEYGLDTFIGFAGVVAPEFFGPLSIAWFLGGKQIYYGTTTITPMISQGINPGLMEYQPFK